MEGQLHARSQLQKLLYIESNETVSSIERRDPIWTRSQLQRTTSQHCIALNSTRKRSYSMTKQQQKIWMLYDIMFLITATSGSQVPNPHLWFYVVRTTPNQTQRGNEGGRGRGEGDGASLSHMSDACARTCGSHSTLLMFRSFSLPEEKNIPVSACPSK